MKMDVVLLAGGHLSSDDPLNLESSNGYRSLIPIHGKPMAQWVIDALDASEHVREMYTMGLPEECGLHARKPLHFMEDYGGLFENIRAGVQRACADHPEQSKVLLASADIPAIRREMVDWLVNQVQTVPSAQIYYSVVSKKVMETRYPLSNRSFVQLKDIAVCGADLNVVDISLFTVEQPIWEQLVNARKTPLKQVSMLGFLNLLLVGLRLVTLENAVSRVCQRLSIEGRVLVNPFAEMAMDADKPHQLAILREDLAVPL